MIGRERAHGCRMTDWRTESAQFTKGLSFALKRYERYTEQWDHDHCAACTEKFSETIPGALRQGYATPDNYYWICHNCFNELKEEMGWKLI